MFRDLSKGLDKLGKDISKTMNQVGSDVSKTFDETWRSARLTLQENFRSGNVIQLISRSSGRALQIVTAVTGQLVVDGVGPEGPQFLHAHWTVLNEGKNIVRLQNQQNYLAVVNGTTCLQQFPDPSVTSPETRFRLHQIENFICLESVKEPKHYVGILRDGTVKSAVATSREIDGQFGVRLIYSPYGAPAGAAGGVVKK